VTRNIRARAGFTVIELLVVIGILTILAGLIMAGVNAVRIRQQVRSTEDVVAKLQVGVDNQVKALVDQALKDRKDRTNDFQNLVALCGDEDRAQALLVYLKLRHAFPQTLAEAQSNVTLTVGTTTYINWLPHKAYAGLAGLSGGTADQQSAALLYAGLSGMGAGGNAFATDDTTASAQIDIPLTGGSARVFKDAWGNPVGFRRFWQTPAANYPGELDAPPYTNTKDAMDPFDTQNKLSTWTNTTAKAAAEGVAFVPGGGQKFDGKNKVLTPFSYGVTKTLDNPLGSVDDVLGYRLKKLGNKGAL